jgi:hypothetical protein
MAETGDIAEAPGATEPDDPGTEPAKAPRREPAEGEEAPGGAGGEEDVDPPPPSQSSPAEP